MTEVQVHFKVLLSSEQILSPVSSQPVDIRSQMVACGAPAFSDLGMEPSWGLGEPAGNPGPGRAGLAFPHCAGLLASPHASP